MTMGLVHVKCYCMWLNFIDKNKCKIPNLSLVAKHNLTAAQNIEILTLRIQSSIYSIMDQTE